MKKDLLVRYVNIYKGTFVEQEMSSNVLVFYQEDPQIQVLNIEKGGITCILTS